jgi:hypothetical protein
MTQQELTADEMSMIKEAIIAEIQQNIDATVVNIDKDTVVYEVNVDAKLVQDFEFDTFTFVINSCSGFREFFDSETGESFGRYYFSKYELKQLKFDC